MDVNNLYCPGQAAALRARPGEEAVEGGRVEDQHPRYDPQVGVDDGSHCRSSAFPIDP